MDTLKKSTTNHNVVKAYNGGEEAKEIRRNKRKTTSKWS